MTPLMISLYGVKLAVKREVVGCLVNSTKARERYLMLEIGGTAETGLVTRYHSS